MGFRLTIFRALALALLALLLPACGGGGGGGGGGAAGPPAFALSSASPPDGALGVPRRPVIYLRFNRALNPATVVAANFALAEGASAVAIDPPQYVAAFREVRIVPSAALTAGLVHTLTVGGAVTDSGGAPFPGASVGFTTNAGDDTRPPFLEDVAAGTPTTTTAPLTWTPSADLTAVYDVFLSLQSGLFDFAAAPYATAPAASTGHTVTGLASNTTYYFVVRPRDPDGNVNLNETQVTAKTLTSFLNDVWPIVNANCRTCHTSQEGAVQVPDMNMSSAATLYTDWFDVDPLCSGGSIPGGAKRIKPGGGTAARDASFVWNKIKSKADGVAAWCGSPMPLTGGALNSTQLATFEAWILEGAPNN